MRRILVIGTTGSGKTTLARRLARILGIPHAEQDAWQHLEHWQEAPLEEFRANVEAFTAGDAWVMDGNYSKAKDISWPRADAVVWLDYSAWTVLGRLLRRTLRRVLTRERLWNGNVEGWDALLSRQGILAWFFRTYWKRRRNTPRELAAAPHLDVVHLRSPAQAERWLRRLARLRAAEQAACSGASGSHRP